MSRVAFITDQHIRCAERWEETRRIMTWCAEELLRVRPSAIALGGDLFDRAPSVEEVREAGEWLRQLAEIAPVVGVSGNHDPKGLEVFNMLESRHPIRIAESACVHVAGGVEFALLPWPRKAHLLAALGGVSAEDARQVGVDLLLDVVRGLGLNAESALYPRCFVGHVQLRGAKVSTGQPLAPGADFELGLDDLALARCDAYLLGHIHLPDDMETCGAPVSYGGSFRRTAYGEVEEKSIVLIDFSHSHGVARSRVTIPCAPMHLIEAQWCDEHVGLPGDVIVPAGLFFNGGREALPDVRGAEVRVRYMVEADKRAQARADARAFRDELLASGAVDVKVEEEVVATSSARAPEVALAKTTAEKLAAYWAAKGTTPEEPRRARLLSMATEIEVSHAV